ncbi:MAG: hypothetical protein ACTSRG_13620 [Candidatus Helarchaeota archaeon]
MEVRTIPKKVIFDGIVKGTIASLPIRMEQNSITFVIQLNEKIEGVPKEITVLSATTSRGYQFLHLRLGDKVRIKGQILKVPLQFWKAEHIGMKAERIYNDTLLCGL